MKKLAVLMALIAAFAITFVSTGCKNGEDGDNGTSAESLILRETGNKWYKYKGGSTSSTSDTKPSSSSEGSLADIYIKYNTSTGKLLMAAVGTNAYATTEKDMTSSKWSTSAVALRVAGKIETQKTDPTSGKKLITDVSDWGDYTLEALITKLFE